MSKPLTQRTTDHSDEKGFGFSFFCDICGKEWRSPDVPFDSGFTAIEHEEGRQMIWAQEHKAAFEAANLEAHMQFNLCQNCGKRVCDNCYCFDDEKKEGLCKKCV
jgi:hypothetical protein